MDDQERNHEALIDRIAEQARIIRHRNDRITEVEARANELALELAHAATRADKAEKERDEWKDSAIKAMADLERAEQPRPVPGYNFVATGGHVYQNVDDIKPPTADDITDEMVERGARQYIEEDCSSWERSPALAKNNARESVRGILTAALTDPPRPEGAEKVEAVLHQYWSGDINGDDLADRIVEEMNR